MVGSVSNIFLSSYIGERDYEGFGFGDDDGREFEKLIGNLKFESRPSPRTEEIDTNNSDNEMNNTYGFTPLSLNIRTSSSSTSRSTTPTSPMPPSYNTYVSTNLSSISNPPLSPKPHRRQSLPSSPSTSPLTLNPSTPTPLIDTPKTRNPKQLKLNINSDGNINLESPQKSPSDRRSENIVQNSNNSKFSTKNEISDTYVSTSSSRKASDIYVSTTSSTPSSVSTSLSSPFHDLKSFSFPANGANSADYKNNDYKDDTNNDNDNGDQRNYNNHHNHINNNNDNDNNHNNGQNKNIDEVLPDTYVSTAPRSVSLPLSSRSSVKSAGM